MGEVGNLSKMEMYGDFDYCGCAGEEVMVKAVLKQHLHELVDKLCEREDFWIKRDVIHGKPPTIGWKIGVYIGE